MACKTRSYVASHEYVPAKLLTWSSHWTVRGQYKTYTGLI